LSGRDAGETVQFQSQQIFVVDTEQDAYSEVTLGNRGQPPVVIFSGVFVVTRIRFMADTVILAASLILFDF